MDNKEFLADLIQKRSNLIKSLEENDEVNLDIFKDFYPDKAHFIFELLQNAEDAEASVVEFRLHEDRLVFQHNGKILFSQSDVGSITGINNSGKPRQDGKIGRWGIGFKSVFLYTSTPIVRSGDFSFIIEKLILPVEVEKDPDLDEQWTQIVLPFNSQRKSVEECRREIKDGLVNLNDTTLLHLQHIQKLNWKTGKVINGNHERIKHSENHLEIHVTQGTETRSNHYLIFSKPVNGMLNRYLSIAYELGYKGTNAAFNKKKSLASQFVIRSSVDGQVAVFFPATGEKSNLKFHIHAPFEPDLSRSILKNNDLNHKLFKQLDELFASTLVPIKEMGLLDLGFLEVLPNSYDSLTSHTYLNFRSTAIKQFKELDLLPTADSSHRRASLVYQATKDVKSLISSEDLQDLDELTSVRSWLPTFQSSSKQRTDRFIKDLKVEWLNAEWLIDRITTTSDSHAIYHRDVRFRQWFRGKDVEWHKKLWLFFANDPSASDRKMKVMAHLPWLCVGEQQFGKPAEYFFPGDKASVSDSSLFPRIDPKCLILAKNNEIDTRIRTFLENCGVRYVRLKEEVEGILKSRYAADSVTPTDETLISDMKLFLQVSDTKADIDFSKYFIFIGEDGEMRMPDEMYLDDPYLKTGLKVWFHTPEMPRNYEMMSILYSSLDKESFCKFCEELGVLTSVPIEKVSCSKNLDYQMLRAGTVFHHTGEVDEDYRLEGLNTVAEQLSLIHSFVIWNTMVKYSTKPGILRAKYAHSKYEEPKYSDSQLVQLLTRLSWIPQVGGDLVTPGKASLKLIPKDYKWVKSIFWGLNRSR